MTNRVASPIDDRFFEDYLPGSTYEFGDIELDEQEIIEFARRYDPQPIHVDSEAAGSGPFGGVIASSWHTAAVMMHLYCDHYLSRNAAIVSPGIDELRWNRPVRPGDSLRIRLTGLEANRSTSKPDRGLVRTHIEVLNHDDESHEPAALSRFGKGRSRRPGAVMWSELGFVSFAPLEQAAILENAARAAANYEDQERFDCANWLHKAKTTPTQQLEQALEIALRMLG